MGGTRFMVQWEEHPSHLATRLGQLLEHQTLVDVTLMCNTHTLRVHRAVLAACSPYFETILQRQLGMHPLIVLKDMQFSVLKSLIEFMYCGETSVTEDNLGALLQAAKFFQVKGLSAMTKEALGLVPNTKSTINGDAARKAFVGRPKRVGMQQTFVTSGLKTVPASHASSSHTGVPPNELPSLPTKTTFQTISKSITVRPDAQQQTDTAQLLLSLSGSEFPKQTFHTVSKNVRFQHSVSSSAVSVESPRSSSVEGNVKTKEVVGRIPVITSNGGKTAGAATAATTATSVVQQGVQIADHTTASVREDVLVANPQSVYLAEGHRRRGRPVKRQMNMLFQERVMTDADAALHKEAEASRKALEMLRQEMSSETIESGVSASSSVTVPVTPTAVTSSTAPSTISVTNSAQVNAAGEQVHKGLVKHGVQSSTKMQIQSVPTPVATTSRTVTATQNVSSPLTATKRVNTNMYKTVTNNSASNTSVKKTLPNSTLQATDNSTNNGVNAGKVEETEIPSQVYEFSSEPVDEPPKEESVEYQYSTENVEGESESGAAGSVMSQYMEVLKEAGLPTDVPILLDSGDGSYVTVNEEVLMKIVHGGVLQCHVTEGNFVAGEGVEFIVQEITEDEMEAVQAQVQEQSGDSAVVPKEIENSVDIAAIESQVCESADKLPVSEKTQDPECLDSLSEQAMCQETLPGSLTETQNMDESSEILQSDMSQQQESLDPANEAVDVQNDGTVEQCVVDETVQISSETKIDVLEIKSERDSEFETKCASEQGTFDSSVCSAELLNNENDHKNIKTDGSNEMSVEQALQAMMGESSDTEMEPCGNSEIQGVTKDENVTSGLETMSQTMEEEEKSEDLHLVLRSEEGTEDLRLVLSNDAGDSTDDNSNSYALGGTESIANNSVDAVKDNEHQIIEAKELPSDITQEVEMEVLQESVIETPENNEYESVVEHSGEVSELEHVEPLQVESLCKEESSPFGSQSDGEVNTVPKLEEDLEGGEGIEHTESVPGCEVSGDSQEVSQLTSSTMESPAVAVCNSASEYSKPKGAIISPSKDIPYAVGLLPLKTALEKLQAMPEYHPRKTRSSSTGKESTPDMPAARVKRKASSSDGADKRLKLSAAEESAVAEQTVALEPYDGDASVEVEAPCIPEERKEETVLSMPELVTEPTEG
ncbi:hypothetical protein R5R35_013731 [Gryllus longicercus]|uniref:BTB domain-containing protein n=1 Tax=Gryllus longicercus TaxID=2509291 RepID=A0AAN9W0M0_9ORTH